MKFPLSVPGRVLGLCLTIVVGAQYATAQDDTAVHPATKEPGGGVRLFNGKDFSGWTFCMEKGAKPEQTWAVTDGVIHCTGKATGYLRSTESYHDYALTVVWRFVKVTPKADNTGILVHIQTPDKVWPKCVQIQGKHDHLGDMFLMEGAESKEHKGMDKNTPLPMRGPSTEKPVGQWNKVQILCRHDKVTCFVNGKLMNAITESTVNRGCIGFQSEGADFEIRDIILSPLK